MKKLSAVLLSFLLVLGLAACGEVGESASVAADSVERIETDSTETDSSETGNMETVLIAYASGEDGDTVERAARLLAQEPGGDLLSLEADASSETEAGTDMPAETDMLDGPYEYIFLGFEAQNNVLLETVQNFLEANDFGARTIIPFVSGTGNDSAGILEAVSLLQPGALLSDSVLLLSENMEEQEITDWAMELGFF